MTGLISSSTINFDIFWNTIFCIHKKIDIASILAGNQKNSKQMKHINLFVNYFLPKNHCISHFSPILRTIPHGMVNKTYANNPRPEHQVWWL